MLISASSIIQLQNRSGDIQFEYTWMMVANITVSDLPGYKGEPLSWDNVYTTVNP